MYHRDGIEVYLKPAGQSMGNLRFREYDPDPAREKGSTSMKGYVIATPKSASDGFRIVVRFSDTFNTYTASAVQVAIKFGSGQMEGIKSNYRTIQASWVTGQQHVYDKLIVGDHEHTLRMVPWDVAIDAIADLSNVQSYQLPVNDGSVTVYVRRGQMEWEDGYVLSKREFRRNPQGDVDPSLRRRAKSNTFKPLGSKSTNGELYRFEFWPRSKARLVDDLKAQLQAGALPRKSYGRPGKGNDATPFKRDHFFLEAKQATDRIRKDLGEKWVKKQNLRTRKQAEATTEDFTGENIVVAHHPPSTNADDDENLPLIQLSSKKRKAPSGGIQPTQEADIASPKPLRAQPSGSAPTMKRAASPDSTLALSKARRTAEFGEFSREKMGLTPASTTVATSLDMPRADLSENRTEDESALLLELEELEDEEKALELRKKKRAIQSKTDALKRKSVGSTTPIKLE